jgi:uncharacterized membrane protein YhaH (DUF805 family)
LLQSRRSFLRPIEIAKSAVYGKKYELKLNPLATLALITFSLSVLSFVIMRTHESHIAGWTAVIFGFTAIISMTVSGLRKLKTDKITESKN